jgi:hypothetical protein
MLIDVFLSWQLVELLVDLVEGIGLARELVSLCFVLRSAAETLCLWWVVESYISLLLQ